MKLSIGVSFRDEDKVNVLAGQVEALVVCQGKLTIGRRGLIT